MNASTKANLLLKHLDVSDSMESTIYVVHKILELFSTISMDSLKMPRINET